MAEFTPNYRLHQWEPTDPFLREDFNQDLSTIDTALARAERSVEASAYNVYNLMLQNYYEGKYTGYKQAMLFDGFQDSSGISSCSGFLRGSGCLLLSRTAQPDIVEPVGSSASADVTSKTMTMTGVGKIKSFQYYLYALTSGGDSVTIQYTLTINGSVRQSGSVTVAYPTSVERDIPCTLSLSDNEVLPGDTVSLRLISSIDSVRIRKNSSGLSGTLSFTSSAADNGSITGKAAELPAGSRVMAWVRYKGGTVELSLKSGGKTFPLTEGESRATTELMSGGACIEQSFSLTGPLDAGNWQLVLRGTLREDETEMEVFDYGLIYA